MDPTSHIAIVTLTVAFEYEDEQTEDQLIEIALEHIGSSSDRQLGKGMSVTIDGEEQ